MPQSVRPPETVEAGGVLQKIIPAERAADIFMEAIFDQSVKVLGMLDRERFSPTYGCLDRTHWAWKFTDFPGARFQEGLCVLSYLYSTPIDSSPYYGNSHLRDWIAAGFDFWCRIQRRGGDFDEAYPFERSLAATAFSSFYLSEAWHFLDGDLPSDIRDRFLTGLERAANWLVHNDETHGFLSNHLAAAAGALLHAHRIIGDRRFQERGRYFLDKIFSHQSSEGWYDEYGGADPGYQTHGSFYLARCLQLGADPRLRDSLERSLRFLTHFVHPDGSLGGEYASRNTQTYYPAAFEMLADTSSTARWIADTLRPSVVSLAAAGLGSVDAYNLFPLLNNYVFAHRAAAERKADLPNPEGPPEEPGQVHFRDAGFLVVRRSRYELIVGLHKGGVIKLFDRARRRLVGSDCGWIGRLRNGRVITSQWSDPGRRIEVSDDRVTVAGNFVQISRPVMSPWTFVAFRLFTLTLGRFPRVAGWVKALLVKVLIYRKSHVPLHLTRTISLLENGIEIRDCVRGTAAVRLLVPGERFTSIHMGSSRYFVPNELSSTKIDGEQSLPTENLSVGVEHVRQIVLE